jgi:hypothetical protein
MKNVTAPLLVAQPDSGTVSAVEDEATACLAGFWLPVVLRLPSAYFSPTSTESKVSGSAV